LLVDEHGVPLSIIVTGANRHDVSQIEAVLEAIVLIKAKPAVKNKNHLCADAGYRGKKSEEVMIRFGYIPNIKGRNEEAKELKASPSKKAKRWVVEVAHSWFNRFRKLLVRYEKLERSFLALHHLAAAIIALRKIKSKINIIYG